MPLRRIRTALITGGGRGLGAEIGSLLAERGVAVGITSRSATDLEATCDRLRTSGSTCVWRQCDAAVPESVAEALTGIVHDLGSVDLLVNNAGGWVRGTLEATDPGQFRALVEACVLGTFNFCFATIPYMKAAGGGFILNIGSTAGVEWFPGSAAAGAPKAAVCDLSRRLRQEVAEHGIRVALLNPARIGKWSAAEELESRRCGARFLSLSHRQVAAIALFMIDQPENVAITELSVVPTGA